jgi:hypothetical protein
MRPKSTGMEQESTGIDPEFTGVEDFTAAQNLAELNLVEGQAKFAILGTFYSSKIELQSHSRIDIGMVWSSA